MDPDARTVFVNRAMTPEWLTPTEAGKAIAAVARPNGGPYKRAYVLLMIKAGQLKCYETPHGRLVHIDDVIAYLDEYRPGAVATMQGAK